MNNHQTVPGKLYLAGEYAALHPGSPAVIMSINRYLTATFQHTTHHQGLTFTSSQFPNQHSTLISEQSFTSLNLYDPFIFAQSAALCALHYCYEHHATATPLHGDISITSTLNNTNGTKLGLGSSAAVTVAIIKVILHEYGYPVDNSLPSRLRLFKLAALAHYRVQQNGSCGDIAACTGEGLIEYHTFDSEWLKDQLKHFSLSHIIDDLQWPGLSIRCLPPVEDLRIVPAWTGKPASTSALIRQCQPVDPSLMDDFYRHTALCVAQIVDGFYKNDKESIYTGIISNREILESFARNTGIMLETPLIQKALHISDDYQIAAKTSGAGGGDCIIAVNESSDQLNQMIQAWKKISVIPLNEII